MSASPAAAVVPDQPDRAQAEGVHDGQDILHLLGGAVPAPGALGPSAAAQVEAEELVLAGEFWHQLAPGVPVLRNAVQQQDRIASAGLRHVEPGAAGRHEPVGHAGHLRNRSGVGPDRVGPYGNCCHRDSSVTLVVAR